VQNKRDILILFVFVAIGVLTRTILHIGPNVEFITGISISAGYFFSSRKYSFMVPLISLAITDYLIGNSMIFLFTWSAFLIAPAIGNLLEKFAKKSSFVGKLALFQAAGAFSTLIFFLWTNFGVVITTSMYANNLAGLMQSYVNALPFLRNQLGANLVIVPFLFAATHIFTNYKVKSRTSPRLHENYATIA